MKLIKIMLSILMIVISNTILASELSKTSQSMSISFDDSHVAYDIKCQCAGCDHLTLLSEKNVLALARVVALNLYYNGKNEEIDGIQFYSMRKFKNQKNFQQIHLMLN